MQKLYTSLRSSVKKEIEHFFRETPNTSTCVKDNTQESLASTAAAFAAAAAAAATPESASTGVWQQARGIFEQSESGDKGSTAGTQCPTSTWQQVRGTDGPVDEPNVDIDLRTDGITQEAILNDKEHMKEIHDKVERLNVGSRTKCIYDDLKKDNMIFSEETSRVIHEMGNMEFSSSRDRCQ